MSYTMEDFKRDYVKEHLKELTPEGRHEGLSPEERLAGLSAEERLEGLSLKERLEGLSGEEIVNLLRKLKAQRTPPPRKTPRKKNQVGTRRFV
jgi:hypothetical protein